ncbi:hypothetical protein F4859DRAFT_480457 [Xylaria cf. heliscus]|nr:hypothetical protein F4859DRAFT_480457 [Xylaria cf. heliscus]
MSGSLTFSHISADGFEEEARLKAGRKRSRMREAVSCSQCRGRKIRCDRTNGLPCKQCRARGSECSFKSQSTVSGTSTPRREKDTPSFAHPITPPEPAASTSASREGASTHHLTDITNCDSLPAPESHVFRGSERKTRMVGMTHWMSPGYDTWVLKAFLERSAEFEASQKLLRELKFQVRILNVIPTSVSPELLALLPDRHTSEGHIQRYIRTYGLIYNFIDAVELQADLDRALDHSGTSNIVHLLRALLAIAISMQSVGSKHLISRRIGQQVEHYVRVSDRLQKPCIGVMQVLLLLIILKTMISADADSIYDLLGIQGLTSQIAFSMGLHRDPALFMGVSPYYAEIRKRLWACFFRLNLEFCIRSGTQLMIRLEDCDCPLPSDRSLSKTTYSLEDFPQPVLELEVDVYADGDTDADAVFGLAAVRLARLIAPTHQILCSPTPRISADMHTELRSSFRRLLDSLPPYLRPGCPAENPMQELQQAIICTAMHTSLLIINSIKINSASPDVSQQGQLLETWNYASSILYQFQMVTQDFKETSFTAFHILWTYAGRAAFTSCVIVGRLRGIDSARVIPVHPKHAVSIFAELLTKSLTSMLELWLDRSHRGPVAIKTYIMLAICQAVTSNLYSDFDNSDRRQELCRKAVSSTDQAITELKDALQRHQAPCVVGSAGISRTYMGITSGLPADDDAFSLPDDLLAFDCSTPNLSIDAWQSLDLSADLTHLQHPGLDTYIEDPSMDMAF